MEDLSTDAIKLLRKLVAHHILYAGRRTWFDREHTISVDVAFEGSRNTQEQWDEAKPLLDELVEAGCIYHNHHRPKYSNDYWTYDLTEDGILAVMDGAFFRV